MKTPIQELLDYTTDLLHTFDSEQRVAMAVIDYLKTNKRSLLEKEREVMCEFAFNCGDEIKDQNNWRSPRNLTNYEVIQDFYNETFNTKEK